MWRLEPFATIGSVDGAGGAAAFTAPFDLDLGPDGNLYVLDAPGTSIQVYSPGGELLREIGREGEGPGELERASAFDFEDDSLLWVLDGAAGRASRFDLAGQYMGSKALPYRLGRFRHGHARVADGMIWDITQVMIRESLPGGGVRVTAGGVGSIGIPTSLSDEAADTVRVEAWRPDMGMVRQSGSTRMTSLPPFAPGAVYSVGREGGLWTAKGNEYLIAHVLPGGDTTRIVGRTVEPTPLSAAHAAELAVWERDMREGGAQSEGTSLPTHYPILEQVVEDDQGNLWVWRRGPTGWDIDIFDPDGVFLGTLESPPTSTRIPAPPAISRGVLVTAEQGELDVPIISSGSVIRPGRRVP